MADLISTGSGTTCRADAALRSAGGRCVLVRIPQPAVAGDDGEQLGLATPLFSDIELAPAVFRHNGDPTKLIISATAIDNVVGSLNYDSAQLLLLSAVGLVIDGEVYSVVSCTAATSADGPFAYYVTVAKLQP